MVIWFLNLAGQVFILMKSVNFAVQVVKTYYVRIKEKKMSIRNPSKYEIILY